VSKLHAVGPLLALFSERRGSKPCTLGPSCYHCQHGMLVWGLFCAWLAQHAGVG
jgi:hypothetical protein